MSRPADGGPITLFFSYSHRDQALRDDLEKHLSALKRINKVSGWHDHRIGIGDEWKGEIDKNLHDARVILLLVSSDFLASNYCYDVEMKTAMKRRDEGKAVVVPVILRPVDITGTPLAELQALPTNGRPVTTWPSQDLALENVAEGIRAVVDRLEAEPAPESKNSDITLPPKATRTLDAAVAKEWPINEAREVTALIRWNTSNGLRAVLQESAEKGEQKYLATALRDDVVSTDFPFHLPASEFSSGLKLTLRVSAPDCEPAETRKSIFLPAREDSPAYAFLFRARREGIHVIDVEVICDEISIIDQLLKTTVKVPQKPPQGGGAARSILLAAVRLGVTAFAKSATASH